MPFSYFLGNLHNISCSSHLKQMQVALFWRYIEPTAFQVNEKENVFEWDMRDKISLPDELGIRTSWLIWHLEAE